MLLQIGPDVFVRTFYQLYDITLKMLEEVPGNNKTVVLGPVTSKDPAVTEGNLAMLSLHARALSEKGWIVLDLASYQETIERLIKSLNIQGYPHEVLEDFTIPLLQSGIFQTVFVRECFEKSIGATLEHDAALGKGLHVEYLTEAQ